MAWSEEDSKKMDEAAKKAMEEFDIRWTAAQLVEWWAKWYATAGYKRLGRALVAVAKARQPSKAKIED